MLVHRKVFVVVVAVVAIDVVVEITQATERCLNFDMSNNLESLEKIPHSIKLASISPGHIEAGHFSF